MSGPLPPQFKHTYNKALLFWREGKARLVLKFHGFYSISKGEACFLLVCFPLVARGVIAETGFHPGTQA